MHKILLLLLLLPLLVTAQRNKQCAKCKEPCTNCSNHPDTTIVTVTTPVKQQIILESDLKNELLTKLNDKDWWSPWLEFATIFLSIGAVIFAWNTLRRDKRYRDLAFLSEINKLTVENPEVAAYNDKKRMYFFSGVELAAPVTVKVKVKELLQFTTPYDFDVTATGTVPVNVYTNNNMPAVVPAGGTVNFKGAANDHILVEEAATVTVNNNTGVLLQSAEDKMLEEKITAFCYYKLNNFELALKEQNLNGDSRTAWENYFVHTVKNSSTFSRLVKRALNEDQEIFSAKFRETITKLLAKHGIIL